MLPALRVEARVISNAGCGDSAIYISKCRWQTDYAIMNRNSRSFPAFAFFTILGQLPGG
jgi:hypothetical protein